MSKKIDKTNEVKESILSVESEFTKISKTHGLVNFNSEYNYIMQALKKDKALMDIASNNISSLKFAILNIASIGVSLGQHKKQAYFVIRNFEIVLEISYIGLSYLAQKSGSVKWIQSQIVYEKDFYQFERVGAMPTHRFDSFKDRGRITGVYCVAKTQENDFLVEQMSISQVVEIRDRSELYKLFKNKKIKSTAWITDFEEMSRKTVIRRASKYWPKNEKTEQLDRAIETMNKYDGVDFESEQGATKLSKDQIIIINDLLKRLMISEETFNNYFSRVIKKENVLLSELDYKDAELAIIQLKDMESRSKKKNENEKAEVKEVKEVKKIKEVKKEVKKKSKKTEEKEVEF